MTKPRACPNDRGPFGLGANLRTTFPFNRVFQVWSPTRRSALKCFKQFRGHRRQFLVPAASKPCSATKAFASATAAATAEGELTAMRPKVGAHAHDAPTTEPATASPLYSTAFCNATRRRNARVSSSGVHGVAQYGLQGPPMRMVGQTTDVAPRCLTRYGPALDTVYRPGPFCGGPRPSQGGCGRSAESSSGSARFNFGSLVK